MIKPVGVKDLFLRTGRLQSVAGKITATLRASIGELVEVRNQRQQSLLGEVIGFDRQDVQIMPLCSMVNVAKNDLVIAKNCRMKIPVGRGLLGRILDAAGKPIDGKGPLSDCRSQELHFNTPDPLKRSDISKCFVTGVRSIDGLITIGQGQRIGLFAGSGVGKSTLLGDIARNADSDVNVVALIGERGREVRPFVEKSLSDGLKKTVMIVSTADQSPLARVRAIESAIKIASWFRDQGKNTLLMVDSLTRLAMAQRELGLILGEPPTSRGYTPSVFQKMAVLLEQLGTTRNGSITALLTILVDGDDMNDPIADAARSFLDGHIVLSRRLAERAHFPAIDVLASSSRLFMEIASEAHQSLARQLRELMAVYRDAEDLISLGAYQNGSVESIDRAIALQPAINNFLRQPLGQTCDFATTLQQLEQTLNVVPGRSS